MKKYVTALNAKRLMIVGASLYAASLITNFVVLSNVYGKAAECLNQEACSLDWQVAVARIAGIVGTLGVGIFLVGLVTFIFVKTAKKKS